MLGTKIMPIGASVAIAWASWPAPLANRFDRSPVADAASSTAPIISGLAAAPSFQTKLYSMWTPTCLVLLLLLTPACRRADPDRAALEKQFEEALSGATLVGHFTRGDKPGLSEEKYTISKVSKLGGDTWLFHSRIQYGSRDVTVPIPLTVQWAGDTPVITLTDLSIPGLGTYTARVMIYRGQYAGTWRGKDHGGHLYGRLTK